MSTQLQALSTVPAPRALAAGLLVLAGAGCVANGAPPSGAPSSELHSFAVYVLSRGRGVPAAAEEALSAALALVEQDVARGLEVSIERTVIGLEGERRVCFEYADAEAAAAAHRHIGELVSGIDLINLIVEPCAAGARPPLIDEEEGRKP